MFTAALILTFISSLPLQTSLQDCRKGIREVRTRAPSLRGLLTPLELDLAIEPRITPGMSLPRLGEIIGPMEGSAFDWIYPVKFEHRFQPLRWITRISTHEVHFDTRFASPDGECALVCHWSEARRYYLTIFPSAAIPLLEIQTTHFGKRWPLPEYETFYPPGSFLASDDKAGWEQYNRLRKIREAGATNRRIELLDRLREAKQNGIEIGPIQLAPVFAK